MLDTWSFTQLMLALTGGALAVGLVVTVLVFAGSRRRSKKYRPGRPFAFTPVWFVSAPEQQARSGVVRESVGAGRGPAKELATGGQPARVSRPRETGGASDRW